MMPHDSNDQPLAERVSIIERTMPDCDNCQASKASKETRERWRIGLQILILLVAAAGLWWQIFGHREG